MGVEVKSGGEGVIVADRGCNDAQEWPTGNQVSYREHC